MLLSTIIQLAVLPLPWKFRRGILNLLPGFKLHPGSRIGLSLVLSRRVLMADGARIGHLNLLRNLEELTMESGATIGRTNHACGYLSSAKGGSFEDSPDRSSSLVMRRDSAITNSHHLDCTDLIEIGEFTTIAGYHSQLMTHSLDLVHSEQRCAPIRIGPRSFLGTRVVILPGVQLPEGTILAAGAVVNRSLVESRSLYGGVPARFIKRMDGITYYERFEGRVI